MIWETVVQSQVESYQRLKKWYLIPPCLKLSIIRYGLLVKLSNQRKGVPPSPILWCSSYWKGTLWVIIAYCHQLYFTYIYIYIYKYLWFEENSLGFRLLSGNPRGIGISCWVIILFTNPSARVGYDTRSIFKRSLTGLNSEFSFS